MRRAWKWGMAAVAVAGVAGWALWPRSSPLVMYTSPPIRTGQVVVRVQALVPVDWIPSAGKSQWNSVHGTSSLTVEGQERTHSVVSDWLKNLIPVPHYSEGTITFMLGDEFTIPDPETRVVEGVGYHGEWFARARKSMKLPVSGSIQFYSSYKPYFKGTYRQICESFRVIREK